MNDFVRVGKGFIGNHGYSVSDEGFEHTRNYTRVGRKSFLCDENERRLFYKEAAERYSRRNGRRNVSAVFGYTEVETSEAFHNHVGESEFSCGAVNLRRRHGFIEISDIVEDRALSYTLSVEEYGFVDDFVSRRRIRDAAYRADSRYVEANSRRGF